MKIRHFVLYFSLITCSPAWSFTCFYTLIKDSCWTNYDVSVEVTDAGNLSKLFTVDVPKGKSWTRVKFECSAAQSLLYVAKFSPIFWESDKDKTYPALRNWSLPGTVSPGDLAWTIPVCFPEDFSEVPAPPTGSGTCKCDKESIPAPTL